MRIMMVQPNYHAGGAEIAGNWPPSWVAYIGGALKQAGYTNVRFVDATVMETTMEFEVRIENATPNAIRLDGAVYKVTLNGLSLGRGMTGEILEVPRYSSATQKVQVHLSNLRMATRVRTIVEAQKLDYQLESTLHAVGRRPYSCYREGTLDLSMRQTKP